MSADLLLGFAAFALVTSITPGPNNLMLMASGANYGFRRSIPHMLGVGVGFMVMVGLVGFGLAQIFEAVPRLYTLLKVLSVAYLAWLAWKIARAARPQEGTTGRPMTFLQAAAFQWVNPKAWTMAVTAMTIYLPERSPANILLIALIFGAVNLPSISCWTLMGQQMRRWLTNGTRLRAFNWSMAALLLLSLYPAL